MRGVSTNSVRNLFIIFLFGSVCCSIDMPKRIALLAAIRNIRGGGGDESDNDNNSDSDDAEIMVDDNIADQEPPVNDDQDSDGELEAIYSSDSSSNSSSEQSSDDEVNEEAQVLTAPSGLLWHKEIPQPRRLARNIVNFQQGPRAAPTSESESFLLFITEALLRTVQRCTNRRLRAAGKLPFTYSEIKAAIAITIRAGADRDNLSSVESLFHPKDSRPFYACAMSKNRYRQFMRYVGFDNRETRRARQQADKLAAIRDIWDLWQASLRTNYEPGEWLTVDEQLYGYRGYAPGRAYMPAKPAKYGVKLYWLCDAQNGYALNGIPYMGRPDGEARVVGLAKQLVLDLTRPYYGTNRNIFIDRYFTSFGLLEELLTNGLTMTGTVMSNRRDVPKAMKTVRQCALYQSRFLWNQERRAVLLSWAPKRNKNVLLMSSMHMDNAISDREDRKPVIIMDYNAGKGGVDVMDSRIEDFTCKRKTNRYPLIFFFNMLDISLLNSYILLKANGYQKDRKEFIKVVSDQLAADNIASRVQNSHIYGKLRNKFSQYGVVNPQIAQPIAEITAPRKCQEHGCRKSTRVRCSSCRKYVCTEHKQVSVTCASC